MAMVEILCICVPADGRTIHLKDNKAERIAEVTLQNRALFCRLDERSDRVHVGFAYSPAKANKVMADLSIKPPRFKV